jgi:hypothetical protein
VTAEATVRGRRFTAYDLADRTAMRAGDPISWGAITRGTLLEGRPYQFPNGGRDRRNSRAQPPRHPRESVEGDQREA